MTDINISDSIKYIGVNDKTLDLFESQYKIPNGVSYNSYVILDKKVAIMDTVDSRATDEWIANLEKTLDGRTVDYLVISHLEPDHSANIQNIMERYPEMKLVGNKKTFDMLPQFFDMDITGKTLLVAEGDELNLGDHTLQFFMAPMVHWPEVMVEYEKTEKILFSADGFGKFGTLDVEDEWTDEARRYYFNIVGKYGSPVQVLLKKAAKLDIKTICSLHGPILKENLSYYIDKYNTWSKYEPEEDGVLVAYASMHGNTAEAAKKMASILEEKGAKKVVLFDLSRQDISEAVTNAFIYDKLILAGATYDGGVFPCMEEFLLHLKSKNYQKRTVGIIENGSWAPMAAKTMEGILEKMRNLTICDSIVTIKSVAKEKDFENMRQLADEILK
ncbi:FprA family A-type flavoprotein [Clostridium sp.]|uniref:FprA family A-type flavoprotein n=1 Tax=Clostridium sp. TaxID=1506 RepID=UPI0025851D33|nr:FprA family A-type flavoprotein [Clostridium sp.]MDU4846358.1 FprA family A-type flavoprotein [Clostridium sp.]